MITKVIILVMQQIDAYYKSCPEIRAAALGHKPDATKQLEHQLHDILMDAAENVGQKEVDLVNLIGTIHRSAESLDVVVPTLKSKIETACKLLRSRRRIIDFKSVSPALWISRRGGGPRWLGV